MFLRFHDSTTTAEQPPRRYHILSFAVVSKVACLPVVLLLLPLMMGCAAPAAAPQENPTSGVNAVDTPGAAAYDSLVDDETLRLFYWQAPTLLNPHLTGGSKDIEASRITYEPLASFNQQGELIPLLAAEIPDKQNGGVAEDGTSVTWKLKRDVRWCDGEPFTARDVVFTHEYITDPATNSNSRYVYEDVERLEQLDNHTVRVHFKPPFSAWTIPFVGSRGVILPRHIFAPYTGEKALEAPANTAPIGTGPYCMETIESRETLSHASGVAEMNTIVYRQNPYFRQQEQLAFERVELRGGGAAEAAAEAVFRDETADFAWNLQLDAQLLEELAKMGNGRVLYSFGPEVERLELNFRDYRATSSDGTDIPPNPLLSEKPVRQAIAHAIDRETIAALYGKTARATTNILVLPERYHSPNTADLYPFDLDKAAALLDAAGWRDHDGDGIRDKNGHPLQLHYQTTVNTLRQQTQDIIQQDLASLGVQMTLNYIDAGVFFGSDTNNLDNVNRFNADIQEYYDANNSIEPFSYMAGWLCDQWPAEADDWRGENLGFWCNPSYDALYAQVLQADDAEERRQLFIQMNDMLVEEVVVIPLLQRSLVAGVSSTLEGVELTPWDAHTWNIQDWRRK